MLACLQVAYGFFYRTKWVLIDLLVVCLACWWLLHCSAAVVLYTLPQSSTMHV